MPKQLQLSLTHSEAFDGLGDLLTLDAEIEQLQTELAELEERRKEIKKEIKTKVDCRNYTSKNLRSPTASLPMGRKDYDEDDDDRDETPVRLRAREA